MYENAEKTIVGPGFMNGQRPFVISSPYLVMMLYWEQSSVYVAKNKNVAVKLQGRTTITLNPSKIY